MDVPSDRLYPYLAAYPSITGRLPGTALPCAMLASYLGTRIPRKHTIYSTPNLIVKLTTMGL